MKSTSTILSTILPVLIAGSIGVASGFQAASVLSNQQLRLVSCSQCRNRPAAPCHPDSQRHGIIHKMAAEEVMTGIAQNRDVWVFVAGVFPFAWATVEFWRRIAVGDSFGTGSDSVVIIGTDDSPADSRGRRVLGKDALIVAYVLFALAFGTIAIVLYSVITSDVPPEVLPSSGPVVELL